MRQQWFLLILICFIIHAVMYILLVKMRDKLHDSLYKITVAFIAGVDALLPNIYRSSKKYLWNICVLFGVLFV